MKQFCLNSFSVHRRIRQAMHVESFHLVRTAWAISWKLLQRQYEKSEDVYYCIWEATQA